MRKQILECERMIMKLLLCKFNKCRNSRDVASENPLRVYIHPAKFIFSSVYPFNDCVEHRTFVEWSVLKVELFGPETKHKIINQKYSFQ